MKSYFLLIFSLCSGCSHFIMFENTKIYVTKPVEVQHSSSIDVDFDLYRFYITTNNFLSLYVGNHPDIPIKPTSALTTWRNMEDTEIFENVLFDQGNRATWDQFLHFWYPVSNTLYSAVAKSIVEQIITLKQTDDIRP